MPSIWDMAAKTINERCRDCGGHFGIFDYGAGPFVRCENDCRTRTSGPSKDPWPTRPTTYYFDEAGDTGENNE